MNPPRFPSMYEWLSATEAKRKAMSARYELEMREYGERALAQLAELYQAPPVRTTCSE